MRAQFLRSVLTLASGTAIAQGLNLAFIPLVTRLYGPEAYGGLGYYSALISLLVPFAGLCYPLAIVLPQLRRQLDALVGLSSVIAGAATTIFFIALLLGGRVGAPNPLQNAAILVPAGLIASACMVLLTQMALRQGKFKLLTLALVVGAVAGGVTKVLLGYVVPTSQALIMVTIGTTVAQCVIVAKGTGFGMPRSRTSYIGKHALAAAKRYIRFPAYRFPHAIVVALNQLLPITLLTTFFGLKEAGYFTLTKSVLAIPVNLIGKSIHDVAYPAINERRTRGIKNFPFIAQMTLALLALSLAPLLFFVFFGESSFKVIFGVEWSAAGIYAAWMSLWFACNLFNKPSVAAVSVYEMDSFLLKNGILNILFCSLGFVLGYFLFGSDVAAVALFSLFGVVCQIILIVKILKTVALQDTAVIIR